MTFNGYCEHHRPLDLGYVQWHYVANRRYAQKYTQIKCPVCKRYLFPDELNEPENDKAIKIIQNHERYLEQHPKAKDVLKEHKTYNP